MYLLSMGNILTRSKNTVFLQRKTRKREIEKTHLYFGQTQTVLPYLTLLTTRYLVTTQSQGADKMSPLFFFWVALFDVVFFRRFWINTTKMSLYASFCNFSTKLTHFMTP